MFFDSEKITLILAKILPFTCFLWSFLFFCFGEKRLSLEILFVGIFYLGSFLAIKLNYSLFAKHTVLVNICLSLFYFSCNYYRDTLIAFPLVGATIPIIFRKEENKSLVLISIFTFICFVLANIYPSNNNLFPRFMFDYINFALVFTVYLLIFIVVFYYSRSLISAYESLELSIRKNIELNSTILEKNKMTTIGLLSASISHEIGNAIYQIGAALELLEDHKGTLQYEEYLEKYLKISKLGITNAERIVHTLSVAAGDETQVVRFKIHETVEDARLLCSSKLQGKILLNNNVDKKLVVKAPKSLILQVLINLIVNAAHAIIANIAHNKSPKDFAEMLRMGRVQEIKDLVQRNQGSITVTYKDGKLSITDNGPGVPNEVKEKLFKEIVTTKEIGVGTGIGLYISRQELQKYGCDLVYEPNVNAGSTFSIILR